MELWWRLTGWSRLRLVSGDPARSLRLLARDHRLEGLTWESALNVTFSAPTASIPAIREICEKNGDTLEIVGKFGFLEGVRRWKSRPILLGMQALVLIASLWLPSRVLFIRVEGNETLPANLILERAGECGISFGASRRELRSEQVKNRLLEDLPELAWVGVNTDGCVATVTVRERAAEPDEGSELPGNIVAIRDAIVTEVTATAGTPLCKPGQAVSRGQVLISGYADLGICTRAERAEGEVYGQTRREIRAVLPLETKIRTGEGSVTKKYSLVFGKKRINLYSDSGILHTTCGKMTEVKQLCLPGGWGLPVWLVVESYAGSTLTPASRQEDAARKLLNEAAQRATVQSMTAGQILLGDLELEMFPEACTLTGFYECRELIGRQSGPVFLEGDTNDGENGERGAG